MSKAPKSKEKGEQLALPGVPLEQRQAVWRKHTSERWLRDDPDAYWECVEAIKNGETNQSTLSGLFGVSRNTVQALMMKEFSVEQLQTINAKRAAIVAGQALEKAGEIVEKTTKRELAAVVMLADKGFAIGQLGSGGATSRHEERVVFSVEEFARQVGPGTGLGAGKIVGLPTVVGGAPALGEGAEVPGELGTLEVEVVPLSNNSPLKQEELTGSTSSKLAVVVPLFVPVLVGLMGFGSWDGVGGKFLEAGIFERGGGGRAAASAADSMIHSAAGNFLPLPRGSGGSVMALRVPDGC